MTNEQIIAGNKLIAEFVGFKESMTYRGDGLGHGRKYDFNIPNGFTLIKDTETTIESEWCVILMEQDRCMVEDLIFHESWDWLMPVVDFIEGLELSKGNNFNVTIGAVGYCKISDCFGNVEFVEDGGFKIECVYRCILKFINWYNENKK